MPLKLGMLGMWHSHAEGLVTQLTAHPDEFSLVGGYDPDPAVLKDRGKRWSAKAPGLKLYDTPQALLAEPLDGVVVEGQVTGNLQLARLALERGLPVLLEKPAGTDLVGFRRLVELAQSKHLHLQMAYLFRYMSAVQEAIRRARAGELGEIYQFRGRIPKELSGYQRYVETVGVYQGGMFFEMAGHLIDIMLALVGQPKSVTPFLAHHGAASPETFVDHGVAVFGYPRAWATIEVPAIEIAPHSRRLEIYGSKGALVIPHLGSGHLANRNVQLIEVFRAGDADWKQLDLPAATLQLPDLREFAACVAGRKQPDFSHDHDLAVQETLLRASGVNVDR